MIAKGIDDETRLSQHDLLLRNVAFCKCKLEVLAHLLEQLALHVCYVATQSSNLVYRPVTLEMRHQLYDSLQQLCAFAVLPRLAEAPQLLVRRCQHLQALQSRHRQRQVALRAIQTLYIRCHVGDGLLRIHSTLAHALDLLEEVRQLALRGLYALYAVGIGRGLRGDEGGNVLVEVILVAAERRGGARDGGEGCGVGEDGVQVADWVVVSCRPCQRLYRVSSGRK